MNKAQTLHTYRWTIQEYEKWTKEECAFSKTLLNFRTTNIYFTFHAEVVVKTAKLLFALKIYKNKCLIWKWFSKNQAKVMFSWEEKILLTPW